MYDRWDNEETVRKEAGKKFHFYWQKFHWMRTHALYFFGIMVAALIALVWIPEGFANMVYIAGFGSMTCVERCPDLLRPQDARKLQAVGRF